MNIMTKDVMKRGIVFFIFFSFLLYLAYLFINGQQITTSEYDHLNYIIYLVLALLCVYMIWLYGIFPTHIVYIKFSKAIALFLGIAFIVLSQTVLANDGYSHIYIGDLFSVLGVFTLIMFPTGLFTTDKAKKQKEKEEEIIIEV